MIAAVIVATASVCLAVALIASRPARERAPWIAVTAIIIAVVVTNGLLIVDGIR